jgi:CheY-like chemotaxis protein
LNVDLNVLAEQAVSLTEPLWRAQALKSGIVIQVQVIGEKNIPPVAGDPAELREVLTNLIFNAVHAMPEGGTITLRTRTDGVHLVLEVSDTGKGMTEEVRHRCLEPFFSTKGDKGTGLGLAMVYGIAQRHHAHMEITSQVGVGSTFSFRFPTQERCGDHPETSSIQWARPLKILVVDDQPFIAEIVTLLLTEDLHAAQSVCYGSEALERIQADHFDLLITDQAMPEMTGGQLAASVKALSPDTKIILLTGFGATQEPVEGADAIDLVLAKPVTKGALRIALGTVTANPTSVAGTVLAD